MGQARCKVGGREPSRGRDDALLCGHGRQRKVSIDIMEMDGDIIQTFFQQVERASTQLKVKKAGTGLWNMRYPGYKTFPGPGVLFLAKHWL